MGVLMSIQNVGDGMNSVKGRKVVWLWLVALMSSWFFVSIVFAAHPEIPRISLEELKGMIEQKADVVIIDAQLKEIYDRGHIKGARSLPWKAEITEADVKEIPKDKLIVTYCDCGPGESDSADVAAQLINLGYSNVKVLADPSIRGWKKAGYPMD
jgi:rhodanese-related sulfurtransferase